MINVSATLVADFEWIYGRDPAFDRDKGRDLDAEEKARKEDEAAGKAHEPAPTPFEKAYSEYSDTGDEAVLAPFLREGQKPTKFILRHLRGKTRRRFRDFWLAKQEMGITSEDLYKCAQVGLVEIRGAAAPVKVEHEPDEDGVVCVKEEVMDALDEIDAGHLVDTMGLRVVKAVFTPKKS